MSSAFRCAHAPVIAAILCTIGLIVQPARAQEGTVSFAFDGSSIQLQVLSRGAPGSVEVVDGAAAEVTVADRSGRGGASIRLDGEVLSLENRSGSPADYLIVVPAAASVLLQVGGRTVMAVASAGGGRSLSWRWPGAEAAVSGLVPEPLQEYERPRHSFRVNAFIGTLELDSAGVAYIDRVRVLKVVLGAAGLKVSGDRSVQFGYAEESRWGVVVPRFESTEVTLELPAEITRFKLRTDDGVIFEVWEGRGRAYCEPVAEIRDRAGRDIWVFTPVDGRLECPPSGPSESRLAIGAE
jgi:hypothetical protein